MQTEFFGNTSTVPAYTPQGVFVQDGTGNHVARVGIREEGAHVVSFADLNAQDTIGIIQALQLRLRAKGIHMPANLA